MKKKKSLWNIFLIPILIIVFVQGAVPFLTLIFSGIRSNMENAVIGLDSHTVENRKVVLENDMIEQWSSVYKESDSLSSALTKVLSNHQMDMQGFMGSGKVQEEYLETDTVVKLAKKSIKGWIGISALLITLALMVIFNPSPIWFVLAGAVLGMILGKAGVWKK